MQKKIKDKLSDSESRKLDFEILSFIRDHAGKDSTDSAFQGLALKIFGYQVRRNGLYRRFCWIEKKGPESVKSWKDIPAMPVLGFKELVLAAFPKERAVKIFKTSGTTGQVSLEAFRHKTRRMRPRSAEENSQALRGAHFFDTLKLYEAAIVPPFKKYLLNDAAKMDMRFLIAPPKEAPESSLSFMMGVVSRRFAKGKGKFYFKKGRALFLELAEDLKKTRSKTMILSTAFALKSFLEYLKQKRIFLKLPKGSRLMETGGFKGRTREISKSGLYAECQRYLGIDAESCVSEYGMTELSSQFYSRGLSNSFQSPAWVRTVIIDPLTGKEASTGKKGLLRHFDLANRGSVMAIQTEDLGRALRGGNFEFLGRSQGAELRGCSLSYEEFIGKGGLDAS